MRLHNKRSIESFRIFPFLAWGLIVGFAIFVYHLSNEVEDAAERLQTAQLQQINIAEIETAR